MKGLAVLAVVVGIYLLVLWLKYRAMKDFLKDRQ